MFPINLNVVGFASLLATKNHTQFSMEKDREASN